MAQDTDQMTQQTRETDQMRARIEQQRNEITHTVDQIGNRVNPSHIVARRQDRMRRRMIGWKDAVFGNDQPDFPPPRGDWYRDATSFETPDAEHADADHGMRDRVGDAASSVSSSVREAPTALRRQTRGNPMAAGAIALGAGWLIGSILPESRTERRVVRRIEPQLADAASEAEHEARGLAEDMKEPARNATEHVKDTGSHAVDDVKGQASESARNVRHQSES